MILQAWFATLTNNMTCNVGIVRASAGASVLSLKKLVYVQVTLTPSVSGSHSVLRIMNAGHICISATHWMLTRITGSLTCVIHLFYVYAHAQGLGISGSAKMLTWKINKICILHKSGPQKPGIKSKACPWFSIITWASPVDLHKEELSVIPEGNVYVSHMSNNVSAEFSGKFNGKTICVLLSHYRKHSLLFRAEQYHTHFIVHIVHIFWMETLELYPSFSQKHTQTHTHLHTHTHTHKYTQTCMPPPLPTHTHTWIHAW